jgi:hypothetical protein
MTNKAKYQRVRKTVREYLGQVIEDPYVALNQIIWITEGLDIRSVSDRMKRKTPLSKRDDIPPGTFTNYPALDEAEAAWQRAGDDD